LGFEDNDISESEDEIATVPLESYINLQEKLARVTRELELLQIKYE
jgi:hypothetical protein